MNRTEQRKLRMARALACRQDDLTLCLSNIHDPHNVAAIYRSCDAFGVSRVHLHYTTAPFPELGKKTSASARKWVETCRHSNADELFADLKKDNFKILATTFTANAVPLWEWNFLEPVAIILGNEHSGIEAELAQRCDGELYIPMFGLIQSLNVSVAAAVILAEAARQRQNAGWFETVRISNFEQRLNQWLNK